MQREIFATQFPRNGSYLLQCRIAYGHEPQRFKIDGFCRSSSEFTEDEHPGKVRCAGTYGKQRRRFFLIDSEQSLEAGTLDLKFFSYVVEGNGNHVPKTGKLCLFFVQNVLKSGQGFFGQCFKLSDVLLQFGHLFVIAVLTDLQTDMIEKSAYAREFGKELHAHGRARRALPTIVEGEHLAAPEGMLHGVLAVWNKLQKYRSYGVLQVGCADCVVMIEFLMPPRSFQAEGTGKTALVGIRFLQ